MNKNKYLFLILSIPVIAIMGYFLMHMMVYVLPLSERSYGSYITVTLLIIALGLFVPYWMMKAGFKGAETNDPHETSIELNDIPKDQNQIARK